MRKFKSLAKGFALSLAILARPASAATIDWTLDAHFDDGGTATGTFSVDTVTGSIIAFNVATTAGFRLNGETYSTATAYMLIDHLPNVFTIALNRYVRWPINLGLSWEVLQFHFNYPLTGPAAPINPIAICWRNIGWACGAYSGEGRLGEPARVRYVSSGNAVISAVTATDPIPWPGFDRFPFLDE
jgi:hypothetical protein